MSKNIEKLINNLDKTNVNTLREKEIKQTALQAIFKVIREMGLVAKYIPGKGFKVDAKYFAVWDSEDYLHSGFNSRSAEEAAEAIFELKTAGASAKETREHRKTLAKLGPEEYISAFGYELQEQDTPFEGE